MAVNFTLRLKSIMKFIKHNLNTIIFFVISSVIMGCVIYFGISNPSEYVGINSDNISHERVKVIAVKSQDVSVNAEGIMQGVQELEVRFLTGRHKGKTTSINNILTLRQSVFAKEKQNLIVMLDQPTDDYYIATVYSYDRGATILVIVIAFFLLLIALGGNRGWRSAFGLVFTFVMLIFFLIPMVTMGYSPVAVSVITMIPIVVVSLISLTGFTKKTRVAILSTGIGVILAGVIFAIMGALLHITGYNVQEIETLVIIAHRTDIQIRDLLFAGVLISCLGAVMDIAVSVASSVCEIHELNPDAGQKTLFRAGYRIGRDITGTMANTLILAFAGSFFITLFLFWIYNLRFIQLINMDQIAIEIMVALAGTSALVLTAPLTAFIASRTYINKKLKCK
ncbi:MAG: YibE/F family protein [Firmicutes bacterium HGW-Firmicutes-21]|nr:MAG: YibE/F family protein [Firmicutes bacterium HGW-Firmicutes-21]